MARLPPSSYHPLTSDGWLQVDPGTESQLPLRGQFSASNRHPFYEVEVRAVDRDKVETEQVTMGSPERYSIIERIENRNDSPAFVRIKLRESGA
jgi:hypothetical protein